MIEVLEYILKAIQTVASDEGESTGAKQVLRYNKKYHDTDEQNYDSDKI